MERRSFVRTLLAGLAGSVLAGTLKTRAQDGLAHAEVSEPGADEMARLGTMQPAGPAAQSTSRRAPLLTTRQGATARSLTGRVVAVGIQGVTAVSAVGE